MTRRMWLFEKVDNVSSEFSSPSACRQPSRPVWPVSRCSLILGSPLHSPPQALVNSRRLPGGRKLKKFDLFARGAGGTPIYFMAD